MQFNLPDSYTISGQYSSGFLTFWGGLEMEHWLDIGYYPLQPMNNSLTKNWQYIHTTTSIVWRQMAIHNWLIFLKIALNFTVIKRINSRLFSKTSKVKVESGKWNNS